MASTPPTSSAPGLPGALPQIPVLDNTFGALLIGTFIGLMQYGWTAHQCYNYFRTYQGDIWLLKSLVIVVLVLETFHSVLCMHFCYYYLTSNYFKPAALAQGVWSINLLGVSTGAVILVSQLFFLRRVYLIGRKFRPLVAFCGVLLLTEFGFATAVTVDTFLHPTLHNSNQAWMNSAGVGLAALADTLLTAALTFSLHQSRTGIKRTDGIIDLLILYAINTGLVTGIFNILSFVFAIAMPNNLIYAGIDIVATKLYANSLMAVYVHSCPKFARPLSECPWPRLNSRRALAEHTQGLVHSSSIDMSVLQRSRTTTGRRNNSLGAIDIKVTRETTSANDSLYGDQRKEITGAV
ncbi:hypothetical protein L226DRAFT_574206 [Lentinus tigrinus ALCF2SS1-7]|uniref:DUF6534 domain-containing protein n=1 Tax=Lentinus tigrinus ALCF2SS1-6 TaxID=1328759 RepID=A0A5C2S0E4_9APHY|nr:hypothetical protein L227DRAFT_614227 [Lentinus tigrinus ALCF2SS1-6]RPD71212.1 hypothetical protein L226DRAFT_574206 [Lentinus tigrinus ALCF2SS1-7]